MNDRSLFLAQNYSLVYRVSDADHFIHDPGMTVLPDGCYVVTSPVWSRKINDTPKTADDINWAPRVRKGEKLVVLKSYDKGNSWKEIAVLPYSDATPFVYDNKLYMFCQKYQHEGLYFTVSNDGGSKWEDAVKVLDRPLWNVQNGTVIKNGKLYWAFDEALGNGQKYKKLTVAVCDLSRGIMNPGAWRATESIGVPRIPDEIVSGVENIGWTDNWLGGEDRFGLLEPNVVEAGGRLYVIARMVIDEYATANMCAVFELYDEKNIFCLKFRQYYSLPGGQCKFNIIKDDVGGMFWMASNLATNAQNLIDYKKIIDSTEFMGGPGNERRLLTLWYSLDALHWIPAGIIAMAKYITQSFMYPSICIDGDDIVLLSRSSIDSSVQHDADADTFHRIKNFRDLALDLTPYTK
jgi:hypothetical protein